jgi:hypothetical protein
MLLGSVAPGQRMALPHIESSRAANEQKFEERSRAAFYSHGKDSGCRTGGRPSHATLRGGAQDLHAS